MNVKLGVNNIQGSLFLGRVTCQQKQKLVPLMQTMILIIIYPYLISGVLYAEFSVWVESVAEIRACIYKRSYLIHSGLIWICLSSIEAKLLSTYHQISLQQRKSVIIWIIVSEFENVTLLSFSADNIEQKVLHSLDGTHYRTFPLLEILDVHAESEN